MITFMAPAPPDDKDRAEGALEILRHLARHHCEVYQHDESCRSMPPCRCRTSCNVCMEFVYPCWTVKRLRQAIERLESALFAVSGRVE